MKNIFLLFLVLFLTGCGTLKEFITVEKKVLVPMDIPAPSRSIPPSLKEVEWGIIKQSNKNEMLKDPDSVYYTLTPDEFKNLFDNMQELKTYIKSLIDTNRYYQNAIEENKKKIEKQNENK